MKDTRNFAIGVILIAFGFLFILEEIFDVDIFDVIFSLWPLLLILAGWYLIKKTNKSRPERPAGTPGDSQAGEIPLGESTGMLYESLHESSFIGDTSIRVTSKDFKGGSVRNIIGDIHLNLSEIDTKSGEKTIYVSGVIGDINITLPKDFVYRVRGNSILGDISIVGQKTGGIFRHLAFRSDGYSHGEKQLNITASLVIGDIHIA